MLGTVIMEILKGIGNMFINPLFYWIIILFIMTGYKRVKQERALFGTKIYPTLSEAGSTLIYSLLSGLFISALAVLGGFALSIEIAVILIIIVIILSFNGSAAFLSAAYTIGVTFLIMLVLSFIPFGNEEAFSPYIKVEYFVSLAFLMGILLILEAMMVRSKKAVTYPAIEKSGRGVWIGEHQLKRLAFIPFFCLLPVNESALNLPLFPFYEIADKHFMLVLFPFIIGYHYKVTAEFPKQAAARISKLTFMLGLFVLAFACASVFYPLFSAAAAILALAGKEWIMYIHRKKNAYATSIFHPLNKGMTVLAAIPESPAARLHIEAGETIEKVNDFPVDNEAQFYEALQNSGAFFKLQIRDSKGEIRFIQSAMYETDHHELGIIFVSEPHKLKA